jgi:hypothetical protein
MTLNYIFSLEDKLKNFHNLSCEENKKRVRIVSPACEYYSPDLYTYKYNNYGYRSLDFSSDIDILTVGCSFTFGSGLPFEYTWSQQLQKKIPDKKIATLSWPGLSIQRIISLIFNYFKEIGNPKMIICNFPDFFRMLFLLKNSHQITTYYPNIKENYFYSRKDKKQIEDSLTSPYWGLYISFEYISMLEQYCDSNNIKLIWSTWFSGNSSGATYNLSLSDIFLEGEEYSFMKILKENFKYYHQDYESMRFFGSQHLLHSEELRNCHKELKLKTEDFFELAYDRYVVPKEDINNFEKHVKMSRFEKDKNLNHDSANPAHFGSHRNIHWAEFYYDIIKEKYPEFIYDLES